MTVRYVGKGGSDANNGLTWATRKLTLNGAEDTPVVAGDIVYVGAGTYRELLTVDVSGSLLVTGSASVVAFVQQGSPTVIVSGTNLFSAGVGTDNIFQVPVLAGGVDGVTTNVSGTSHIFTSASGNFQQGHVGHTIRINTIGAYVIKAIGSPTSITVAKNDNSLFGMVSGTSLNYNVGPESPYDILRVDNSSQLTLANPWGAASFNGIQFTIHRPIRYIGDYTGRFTDGVGGIVRVTASDNDQTVTRANCITATSRNYRNFKGFVFDSSTGAKVNLTTCAYIILEGCVVLPNSSSSSVVAASGATQFALTIKDCFFFSTRGVSFTHSANISNVAHLFQNCIFIGHGTSGAITTNRVGGAWIRNCTILSARSGISTGGLSLATGQVVTINNCIIAGCDVAISANVSENLLEDFNNLYGNTANRALSLTGANSNTYLTGLDMRSVFQLIAAGAGPYSPTQFVSPFDLSSQSQLTNMTGTNPPAIDMRGMSTQHAQRDFGALEYDPTLSIKAGQAGMIGGGGMIIS